LHHKKSKFIVWRGKRESEREERGQRGQGREEREEKIESHHGVCQVSELRT
jgi:hypothetical protein